MPAEQVHRHLRVVPPPELVQQASALLDRGYRVALVDPDGRPATRVRYLFLAPSPAPVIEFEVPLTTGQALPSLAESSSPAARFEEQLRQVHHVNVQAVGSGNSPEEIACWRAQHRRLDLLSNQDIAHAPFPAEHPHPDSMVGHTLAYCRAVEDALGLVVPAEVRRMRAILLELERIQRHLADIDAMCLAADYWHAHAHALHVQETLARFNHEATGHPRLHGGIRLAGALLRRVPQPSQLAEIGAGVRDLVALALADPQVSALFANAARLPLSGARRIGALGVTARASGVDLDARRDHPTGILADFGLQLGDILSVPIHTTGDIAARFRQRAAEIDASLTVLDTLVRAINPGYIAGWPDLELTPRDGSGVGIAEGWRGTIVYRVEVDSECRLTRVACVDSSFFNRPALTLTDPRTPHTALATRSFNAAPTLGELPAL